MTAAPNIDPHGRYPMTQAAAALGVHRSTLRRWTDQRLVKCSYHRISKRKVYTGAELLRVWRAVL